MKYTTLVYKTFNAFIAEAVEIAKAKIILHDSLLDLKVRQRMKNKGFLSFSESFIWLIRKSGWLLVIAIAALVPLGPILFPIYMASIIAYNPPLIVLIAATGGRFVYLTWKYRDVVLATASVGKRYKEEFDDIVTNFKRIDDRVEPIEKLLKQCVKSVCVEVYGATSEAFISKLDEED